MQVGGFEVRWPHVGDGWQQREICVRHELPGGQLPFTFGLIYYFLGYWAHLVQSHGTDMYIFEALEDFRENYQERSSLKTVLWRRVHIGLSGVVIKD